MSINKYGFEVKATKRMSDDSEFFLHSHDEYEIYVFFEGDVRYVVEGEEYSLARDDAIIIRKHEMHRGYHNSQKYYSRLVIMVSPDFFVINNCPEYERAFLEENFSKGNKINAEIVRESGLFNALMRLGQYSDDFCNTETLIANSIMVEILHIINDISSFEKRDLANETIKNVIDYINKNFTGDIVLNDLCERFFVSKYHLCRVFKEITGITIQMYIKQKRLTLISRLVNEGKSLSEAAILAGFNNYSSFYRACEKVYGSNPRGTSFNISERK